ncbi:TonB dependent receptor [Solimonas aquatica]|uniref:TonB dependent receptor n=1 Tax=Solimonas aquatica TaxID=489703 RepID=A0A1H9L6Y3_9GAMM|nr:TonB-dependent receptor [Solimonas aquatica]SER07194.1 TonB dependent receptor [Solimonas aquatica]
MDNTKTRRRSANAFALTAIAAAVAGSFSARPAFAQEQGAATAPAAGSSDNVEEVIVTGSRLRRVDAETASPVYTIDRSAIEDSGVATIGNIIQSMPSISGAATNPQVNNGGGDGASTVSLRGLGSERTLVLLNGRRLGPEFDINAIPVNMVDRVDVLKEGAGAIYGSDAVGGVVNIITRKDFTGLDMAVQLGQTSRQDGQTQSYEMLWGTASEKGHVMLGLNYNKQKAISAADRKFSEHALYIYNYYGTDNITILGSSRNPRGRISLPDSSAFGILDGNGDPCGSVTRIPGTTGAATSDYRCYSGGSDAYDYQPFNLVTTPQERASIFSTAAFSVSDSIEVFSELFHTTSKSGYQIAPLPFDARADNVVISADSVYNPFGIDFGGSPATPSSPANPNFLTRFVALGNRFSQVEVNTDQVTGGVRGDLLSTSWKWDLAATYQRKATVNAVSGYILQQPLQDALGPSYIDGSGAHCGVSGSPIAGCTPINLFNTDDPATVSSLQSISSGYENRRYQTSKILELNFNGSVFDTTAGTALAAVGFSYRKENYKDNVDDLVEAAAPRFQNCKLSSETCSGDTSGDDSVKEVYGELYVPLLADQPLVKSLNVTLGLRYSDYDSFGSTTNGTVKLEYRPYADLLARTSYAQVFRAPQITDRFAAPAASNPVFFDPCRALTAADVTANPNLALACQNVPTDGSFEGAPTPQVFQLVKSNENLDPETGHVITAGFVYDSSQLKNFSVNLDYWYYKIKDAIIAPDVGTIVRTCAATGDADLCSLIERYSDGQINVINSPTLNSASFTTDGLDIGFRYKLTSDLGAFMASWDTTYTHSFEYSVLKDSPKIDAVGRYDGQFGNYARYRSILSLAWRLNAYQAMWKTRYISGVEITDSVGEGSGRPLATDRIKVGSVTYHDLVAGYTAKTNTELLVGVNNVFDKQPPLFYQYTLNANTNVETYDGVGRYLYVRVSQHF